MLPLAVLRGSMIRKALTGVFGMVFAMVLAGCGNPGGQSIANAPQPGFYPCPATLYWAVLWSPDGQHIAFQAGSLRGSLGLYVMNPNRTGLQRLPSDRLWAQTLQWLPDSQHLAFSDKETKVITVALDGTTSEVTLPMNPTDAVQFSPDAQLIAYNNVPSSTSESTGIVVANRDGSGNVQLTRGNDTVQQWSPDGTRIAYTRDSFPAPFVATMRADGSDKRQIAEGTGPVRWSPDGRWLSFMALKDRGIHIIRPDGTNEKVVTTDMSPYHPHAWLPDSQHIAFVSPRPDFFLKVIDINTLAVETIAAVQVAYQSPPSWSPDGSQVIFLGYVDPPPFPHGEVDDIYVVNRDGTGLTRLTDNPGNYQCFNWPF